MKRLLDSLNKGKSYLLVFILSFFLSFPYVTDICSGYLSYYGFDLQEFLLWNHTALKGLVPYKDIFYPYGLFNYFRNYNFLFSVINYLISPILLTLLFFIFKKIFKDKFILYLSLAILYLFIISVAGFQTFTRYGFLITFTLIFSCIFYLNKKIKKITLINCGIALGLLFFLINDQGFYLILSFIFLFILNKSIKIKKTGLLLINYLMKSAKEFVFVTLGFLIGVVPFFLLLQYFDNAHAFFDYFSDVRDIVVVAKTPFFSFADSPSNIFTITILYFAIFYNFFKLFFLKHKFSLSSFLQTSLIFIILILEQKSIIRSIDRQITFISLILLMFLVYELIEYVFNKNSAKRIIYALFMVSVMFLCIISIDKQKIDIPNLSQKINLLANDKCYESNLEFFSANNPSYVKIIDLIKKQQNFNGKIFSFPTGDSAFYILLNQKPPYYNSIFEGASYDKQNRTIKYIQNNNIKYITLNTSKLSLQDRVPDYIRQGFLFKYILNNYQPFAVVGNHMILKKDKSSDFFTSEILKQRRDYRDYLLNVYLYKIPYSEGLYKYNNLKENNKLLIKTNQMDKVNLILNNNKLSSENKVISIISRLNSKSQDLSALKLITDDGYSTIIAYNTCKKDQKCIINLANIPLFYKNRTINKIIIEKGFDGDIEIFETNKKINLW